MGLHLWVGFVRVQAAPHLQKIHILYYYYIFKYRNRMWTRSSLL